MSNKAPTPPCPHLWWQQGDKCYQTCSNNSQGRNEDGTCLCNNGGNNQSCHPAFKCVGNSCVPTLDAFSCTKCADDRIFACKNLPQSNPLKGGGTISANTPSLISTYRNNNYDLENPAYIIDGKNYWWRQIGGCMKPSKKETWDIFWNGGVGSINFNVGNKIALHFNIRENIGIMNSYDGKWGNEISFGAAGRVMYSHLIFRSSKN